MHPTTSLPAHQLINHIGFRDWVAHLAGLYLMPDDHGVVAVELDRGGPLRVSNALTGATLPLTIIDVLTNGRPISRLSIERTPPAVPLTALRRRRGARRLALETEMQRKRLLPRWLEWLKEAAESEEAVLGLDVWALKHMRRATFAELAFMAEPVPTIGSRMVWALVCADAGRAVRLFLHWVTTGEQRRLHGLDDTMAQLVRASAGSPYHAEYVRLATLVELASTSAAAVRPAVHKKSSQRFPRPDSRG